MFSQVAENGCFQECLDPGLNRQVSGGFFPGWPKGVFSHENDVKVALFWPYVPGKVNCPFLRKGVAERATFPRKHLKTTLFGALFRGKDAFFRPFSRMSESSLFFSRFGAGWKSPCGKGAKRGFYGFAGYRRQGPGVLRPLF